MPSILPHWHSTLLARDPTLRQFLTRIVLFWVPLAVLAIFIELGFWAFGETWPIADVVSYQNAHRRTLFMRAYFDQGIAQYKFLSVCSKRPSILVLGSSRVGKFRAEMFGVKRTDFYNASLLISSVSQLEAFLETLPPDYHPKSILIGIDYWWLNESHPEASQSEAIASIIDEPSLSSWKSHLTASRKVIAAPRFAAHEGQKLVMGESSLKIGLGVDLTRSGYRVDGSLKNLAAEPGLAQPFVDRLYPTVQDRIHRGILYFEFTESVSRSRLNRLEVALRRLQAKTDLLIGFLPPLYDEGCMFMRNNPRQSHFFNESQSELSELFARLAIPFADCSSPYRLGLDDRFMSDGCHGEEVLACHILLRLLENQRVVHAFPYAEKCIKDALKAAPSNVWHVEFR